MNRVLLLLILVLLPFASARDGAYVGLRLAAASKLYPSDAPLTVGVQAGLPLTDTLEVRAALESGLLNSVISSDALYIQPLADGLRGYVGAGPEYASFSVGGAQGSTAGFGFHLTAGLEATDVVGVFAEVQPALVFSTAALWVRLSAGVNYRFD